MQGGRQYRGKFRGINKSLKPVFGRERRPVQHSKRVLSPVRKSSVQKIMQSQIQVRETVQETAEEPACQKEGSAEHIIKNGPESCSSFEEDQKQETEVKVCSVMIFLNFFLPDILFIVRLQNCAAELEYLTMVQISQLLIGRNFFMPMALTVYIHPHNTVS